MARTRPHRLWAAIGKALMLGACAAAPEVGDDVLDSRLAGPCDRLILSWVEDVSRLRTMTGEEVEPRTADGVGEIELNLLRCLQPHRRQRPLTFAFLSVPIMADSAPVVVTGMPDGGWAWLPAMIAEGESAAVFSAMGYHMEPAEIVFEVEATESAASLAAELMFASGSVSITARATRTETAYTDSRRALVSTDSQYRSMLFGRETGDRYESVSVDVKVRGDPPLAVVDFDRKPTSAVFESGLRLDPVYWRLPRPRPQSEPERAQQM